MEENCETHKGFVDEALSIGFGFKCPPPNAHPFSLSLHLYLSQELWHPTQFVFMPPHTYKLFYTIPLHALCCIILSTQD